LWRELGFQFSSRAWGRIDETYLVCRYECQNCGFSFFDPALAGGEEFYAELEHPQYFSPTREEFGRTLKFAAGKGLTRVLDVGCGAGAFLDQARSSGHETYGLEMNRIAAQKARSKGHRVFDRLLHQVESEVVGPGFDLITLFQVLEHVPDPVSVLREAAKLLRGGGCISVAVPLSAGMGQLMRWDPHQWPPHHVSWWRLRDFRELAVRTELVLVEAGGDALLGAGIEQRWALHNRTAAVLGKRPLWGGGMLPRLVSLVYRRHGSSIYAYLKKPA
jgi:SAM-dependent methyltransferase